MINTERLAVNRNISLKAPRFIDPYSGGDHSREETAGVKGFIKKIIGCWLDNPKGIKIVVDLEETQDIEKSCLKFFAYMAQSDPDLIMREPNPALRQKILESGFPETNILAGASNSTGAAA